MFRERLLLAAMISVLAASSVLAQTRGDVITPPPTKSDGSVIPPPAAHADPGIEKAKPPEQSQLPDAKERPRSDDAPASKSDKNH